MYYLRIYEISLENADIFSLLISRERIGKLLSNVNVLLYGFPGGHWSSLCCASLQLEGI